MSTGRGQRPQGTATLPTEGAQASRSMRKYWINRTMDPIPHWPLWGRGMGGTGNQEA